MRCESRDFFRMAGWGRKVETRWLADAARKAYTNPSTQILRPGRSPRIALVFALSDLAVLRLHMHCRSPSNRLIPRPFRGQCAMINGSFAVEQEYRSNLADYH
jgi:hypothetical protein